MIVNPGKGKGRRGYDATARRERARRQREATLSHAQTMFLEGGFVATTVEAIAKRAGVSAATVYKTYGGKAGLLRELCAHAVAGEGPVPAHDRSDALRTTTDDPHKVVAGWARLLAEVTPRLSPLLLVLATAAKSDPGAAALHADLDADRLERMTRNAEFLAKCGHLRVDVSRDEARDVLWLCSSPELYDLLMVRRGWSADRFAVFVADMMAGALL